MLRPSNPADTISVVGITASGKSVPAGKGVSFTTPQAGAPTVVAATPTAATKATVLLSPPTGGTKPSLYIITLCLQARPNHCVSQNSTSPQLSVTGLTAGAAYLVTATAKVGSKVLPSSNTLVLAMPAKGAPILLTAAATGGLTGAATAAAPGGTTFSKVGRPVFACRLDYPFLVQAIASSKSLAHGAAELQAEKLVLLGTADSCLTSALPPRPQCCCELLPPPLPPWFAAVCVHRRLNQWRTQRHLNCHQPAQGQLHRPAPRHAVSAQRNVQRAGQGRSLQLLLRFASNRETGSGAACYRPCLPCLSSPLANNYTAD